MNIHNTENQEHVVKYIVQPSNKLLPREEKVLQNKTMQFQGCLSIGFEDAKDVPKEDILPYDVVQFSESARPNFVYYGIVESVFLESNILHVVSLCNRLAFGNDETQFTKHRKNVFILDDMYQYWVIEFVNIDLISFTDHFIAIFCYLSTKACNCFGFAYQLNTVFFYFDV